MRAFSPLSSGGEVGSPCSLRGRTSSLAPFAPASTGSTLP